jgi:hypothetical protein
MKDTLDFYKLIYEPLFKNGYTKSSNRARPALSKFNEFMTENNIKVESVLDVGCAWYKALSYWRKRGVKAVGVDVSEKIVSKCKKRNFECHLASATDLSVLEDNSFDLYMATDVYEHLREEDLLDAINEAKRVTKKYFLIRPHPAMDKRGYLHLTVWSLKQWKEFFESNGLKVLFIGDGPKGSKYRNVFLMEFNEGK